MAAISIKGLMQCKCLGVGGWGVGRWGLGGWGLGGWGLGVEG
jgi:hypothetical protein